MQGETYECLRRMCQFKRKDTYSKSTIETINHLKITREQRVYFKTLNRNQ